MTSVAILTASEALAGRLTRTLRESATVARCEAARCDRPVGLPDMEWLAGFDTVVYAPAGHNRWATAPDLAAAAAAFEALSRVRPGHVVLISSAAIYGADHRNIGMTEESAFITDRGREIVRLWMTLEDECHRSKPATAAVTVLRPAALLDGQNYYSRLFSRPLAVTYPGHDPTMQLLSLEDLAGAVRAVVERRVAGTFNVAPAARVPLKQALQIAGAWRLPVPRTAQRAARAVLAPLGLAAPVEQLTYVQYAWTVSSEKLRRETGFEPSHTSAQAIAQLTGKTLPSLPFPDEFGMDPDYIARYCRHLFHLLHHYYWRVEVDGIEAVPREGAGVLVGMHRGFMPFDGTMALYALVRRIGRIPRFLIHPSLTKFPFLADFIMKLGGVMACQENGDFILRRGELLGVFPEGIHGAFTMYRRAYTLGKFGRDEYVRMALRNRAPLLPFVTVGSAEIFPIWARIDWNWFKRYTEWPFLPVTSPVPLPAKWHTRFLTPIHVERDFPPEAADDPALVRRISVDVRQRMQAAIDDMLLRRRSVFAGSIFTGGETA